MDRIAAWTRRAWQKTMTGCADVLPAQKRSHMKAERLDLHAVSIFSETNKWLCAEMRVWVLRRGREWLAAHQGSHGGQAELHQRALRQQGAQLHWSKFVCAWSSVDALEMNISGTWTDEIDRCIPVTFDTSLYSCDGGDQLPEKSGDYDALREYMQNRLTVNEIIISQFCLQCYLNPATNIHCTNARLYWKCSNLSWRQWLPLLQQLYLISMLRISNMFVMP